MQELEKILEKIDELHGKVGSECTSEDHFAKKAWEYCLECVEEIIRKHMNDGWIPAKEKPAEDGFYVATMSGALVGQEEPFVGLAEFEDGEWVDGDDVIAWRLLPDPYRPERREG